MKKLLLSLVAVAFGVVGVSAQSTIFNNPDNHAYFGIRVAGEVTCPGSMSDGPISMGVFNNGGGVEFGGIYNIPVVANFYVEPGLKLFYNTYSVKKEWVDVYDDILQYSGVAGSVNGISERKFGMRIPVMAGYHFDFTDELRLHVFTGPELEVGFSAQEHISGKGINGSTNVYGDGGSMNRVDALWGMGVGLAYNHFYFGVSGSLGMCNMTKDSDVEYHENRVSFSIGYNF